DGRCRAGEQLAGGGRRSGSDGAAGRRSAANDHAEPLVSPPRAAVGVSQAGGRARSVDLWPKRGRESVSRIVQDIGSRVVGIVTAHTEIAESTEKKHPDLFSSCAPWTLCE